MMTSRADVMQTGVVIGQAAEKGYVCVCVHMLGQGESMWCPLGVFCSQSEVLDGHSRLRFHWKRERIEEEKQREEADEQEEEKRKEAKEGKG